MSDYSDDARKPVLTRREELEGWRVEKHGGMWVKTINVHERRRVEMPPTWIDALIEEWERDAEQLRSSCRDDSTGELVMSPDERGLLTTIEKHIAALRAHSEPIVIYEKR